MIDTYILLGGNVGDTRNCFYRATELIKEKIGRVKKKSAFYRSEPWGFITERLFLNQVIVVKTGLNPEKILSILLYIEKELGRTRISKGYSSRTIDLDILFYGNEIYNSKTLTIPHARMHERLFTLYPLYEIAPTMVHPSLKKNVKQLIGECNDKLMVEVID